MSTRNDKWERARAVPCPRCKAEAGKACTLVYFKHLEPQPVERDRYEMRTHHKERYIAALDTVKV